MAKLVVTWAQRLLSVCAQHMVAIPIAAAVTMILVVGIVWQLVRNDQDNRLYAYTRSSAQHFAARLEEHIATRLIAGQHIQRKWLAGSITNQEKFQDEVNSTLEIFQDFQAINWVDPEGVIRWVTPYIGNEAVTGLNLRSLPVPNATLSDAERTGQRQITPPIELAQGGAGFVAYIPLTRDGAAEGFLNIVFRTQPLIEGAFRGGIDEDYHLIVTDDGLVVFESDNMLDPRQTSVQKKIKVGNRTWNVSAIPTTRFADRYASIVDELTLVVGVTLSAAAAFFIRLTMTRQHALRASEKRFRQAERITGAAHWETDAMMKTLTHCSDNVEEVFGLPPERYLGDLSLFESNILPEDLPGIRSVFDALPSDPHPYQVDFRYRHEDGRLLWIRETGEPVFDPVGTLIGFRGTSQNVTVLKEAEQVAYNALASAEEANQAKSEFLATMSHEFRTPLNAILGFSEMMRAQYFGPLGAENYKEYADDIHDSGLHMLALINDILDIAAIEAGKRDFIKEVIDVAGLLQGCVRKLEQIAKDKGVELSLEVPSEVLTVYADKRSAIQVVLNLLSNAIKFTQQNGTVIVSAAAAGQKVMLTVKDTGIGIPPDRLPNITEPFSQRHVDPAIAQEGTGLGLSIVKGIVESHGGELLIKSEVGRGTTVTVTFPDQGAMTG